MVGRRSNLEEANMAVSEVKDEAVSGGLRSGGGKLSAVELRVIALQAALQGSSANLHTPGVVDRAKAFESYLKGE